MYRVWDWYNAMYSKGEYDQEIPQSQTADKLMAS